MMDCRALLRPLFVAQGLPAREQGDWLVVRENGPVIGAWVVSEARQLDTTLVQLDVQVALEARRVMVESFVGFGEDREAACLNALEVFARGVLPVLAAGLWGVETEAADQENWTVRGRLFRAALGRAVIRNRPPDPAAFPADVIDDLHAALEAESLEAKPHWLRLYCANPTGENPVFEALLDNQPWAPGEAAARAAAWPPAAHFWTARWFCLLTP